MRLLSKRAWNRLVVRSKMKLGGEGLLKGKEVFSFDPALVFKIDGPEMIRTPRTLALRTRSVDMTALRGTSESKKTSTCS